MTTGTGEVPDLAFDCLVHDLNNVFQTITDAAGLLNSEPKWKHIAGIILRSVEQAHRIVSGMAEKDYCAMPLEALVQNAMSFAEDFSASTRAPSMEFSRDIPCGLYTCLEAPSLIRVLVNLFINAAQACREENLERCRITIAARQVEEGIRIVIADDGPGIAQDLLPLIFTPRFTTDFSRSGLGLHIVRTLVSQAGGTVAAANGPGRGAVFTIVLPAARPEKANTAAIVGA
jgi:signal transduction histidine kinase